MMGLLKTKVLKEYGLDKEYKVVDSSTPAMLAELKRAYAKKEPFVGTLWSPHWAYSEYELKKLKDPKGAWGKGDGVHTLSRKGFAQDDPIVAKWLKDFKLDREAAHQPGGRDQQGRQGQAAGRRPHLAEEQPRCSSTSSPRSRVRLRPTPAEAKRAVDVAWFPWDEDVAVTYLWKNVLARRGYKMNLKQMDVGPVYTGLATGDLDLNFDAWLPVRADELLGQAQGQPQDLGTWYEPTSLEIAVPSYVKDVKSLADLKGKADLFDGKIIGIEPGTGEMHLAKDEVLPGYGLEKEYEIVDGSTPAMLAELKRAYAKKEPVAVTLWSPHWAYSDYELTKLRTRRRPSVRATRSGPSPARSSPSSTRSSPSGSRTST